MHWDAGMFGGVIETTEGLQYKIRTDRSGPDIALERRRARPATRWTWCMRDEPLPSDLQEGDFIYIRNAGAYTTAYASKFNGFPLPEVRVFESEGARPSSYSTKSNRRPSATVCVSLCVSRQRARSQSGKRVSPS